MVCVALLRGLEKDKTDLNYVELKVFESSMNKLPSGMQLSDRCASLHPNPVNHSWPHCTSLKLLKRLPCNIQADACSQLLHHGFSLSLTPLCFLDLFEILGLDDGRSAKSSCLPQIGSPMHAKQLTAYMSYHVILFHVLTNKIRQRMENLRGQRELHPADIRFMHTKILL